MQWITTFRNKLISSRNKHDNWTQPEDPNQVYHMLMKNFKRVYEGDLDFDGELVEGNR